MHLCLRMLATIRNWHLLGISSGISIISLPSRAIMRSSLVISGRARTRHLDVVQAEDRRSKLAKTPHGERLESPTLPRQSDRTISLIHYRLQPHPVCIQRQPREHTLQLCSDVTTALLPAACLRNVCRRRHATVDAADVTCAKIVSATRGPA